MLGDLWMHRSYVTCSAVSRSSCAGTGESIDTEHLDQHSSTIIGIPASWSTLSIIAIRAILTVIFIIMTITDIFHLTIPVIGASGAIAVASIVVSLATIIFSRRIVPTTGRRDRTTPPRRAVTTAWRRAPCVTTRVEAPRSRGRSTSPLHAVSGYSRGLP